MISIEALADSGLTNKRLRQIFEAQPEGGVKVKAPVTKDGARGPKETGGALSTFQALAKLPKDPTDFEIRCYFETMIRAECLEGQIRCAKNFNKWAAMDLAYASIPIHPLVPDLMKVAMGYMAIENLEKQVAGISDNYKNTLFERDARGKATSVNMPALIQVTHNLVHSLTTRRVAALSTEVYQQFPLLKYVPFSNTPTSRLAADISTQIAEQMSGMFGYRHDYEESIRNASLYTTSVKFKEKAWWVEKQTLPVYEKANGAQKAGRAAPPKYKRRIVREGVKFVTPHPSRTYHDISQPLSKLNNGCGPRWIGHWDVVPIGTILDDPAYFNRNAIALDPDVYTYLNQYPSYFSQYYGDCINLTNAERINPICKGRTSAAILALANDRVANIGALAQDYREMSTVLSQHYKCIVPKNNGLGTYQDPVWLRFVMAANTTVVYAEIVGSDPASVNSYNASDGLLVSPSFGMQAIQWQQMLTNDLNMLVHAQYQSMVEIYALNRDDMTKKDVETIVNQLKNPDFTHIANAVIVYSQEKLAQRGAQTAKGADRLAKIEVDTAAKIREIFNSMLNTLAMAERLMFFSPAELGQVAARTTTATEQKAIHDTTLGIRDYHLVGIKEQMDADKRIIHDSQMAFGSDEIETPVAERYEPNVIEAAGFEIVDDGTGAPADGLYTLRGKKLDLLYDYIYTSRNTDDTPPDAAVAQGIAQVYEVMTKDPLIAENTTLDQRLEFVNSLMEILAPTVMKLRVPPGVDGKKTQAGAVDQMQAQLKQVIPQIGQALQQLQQTQAQQGQQIAQTDAGMKALASALDRLTKALAPDAPDLSVAPAGPPNGSQVNAPGAPIPGAQPRLRVAQPRPVPVI